MRKIAEILNLALEEVVQALWREKIGDHCPCGHCGGRKIFSEKFPHATALAIEIPCANANCQQPPRIRKLYDKKNHRDLCHTCAHSVDPIKGFCGGYTYRGEKYHNKNCERTKELKPHEVHEKERIKKYVQPNSDFKAHRNGFTYKCSHCSGELQRIKQLEKQLRNFWKKRFPHDNFPRIRGKNHLFKLRSIHGPEMLAESARKARDALKAKRIVAPRNEQSNGYLRKSKSNLIRAWTGSALPPLKLCRFCNTLTDGPQTHGKCYREQQGMQHRLHPGLPSRSPGRPVKATDLSRYLSWAVQHYLGTFEVEEVNEGRKRKVINKKSYRRIAEENDTDFNFVSDKIKFIIERLPPPELAVKDRFRRRIEVLRASLKGL